MKQVKQDNIVIPDQYIPYPIIFNDSQKNQRVLLAGKSEEGYYYIAYMLSETCLFFKSDVREFQDLDDMTPMSLEEGRNMLINLLKYQHPNMPEYQMLTNAIQLTQIRYSQAVSLEKHKEFMDEIKKSFMPRKSKKADKDTKSQAPHSHQNERERKRQKRENLLKKYKDIAPVFLDDKQTQICAKMNDEYIFISLDNKKPYFLKLSLKGSKPMTMHDLADFINFAGNSSRVGEVLLYSTPYFQKFLSLKPQTPHPSYAVTMNEKVHDILYRSLPKFDEMERNEISQRKTTIKNQGREL